MTCLLATPLVTAQLPQDSRRAGGIAVIALPENITQVFYQKKPVLIAEYATQRMPYLVFRCLHLSARLA